MSDAPRLKQPSNAINHEARILGGLSFSSRIAGTRCQFFKSVEMRSKKTVDENTVEFKGLLHVDAGPNASAMQPSVVVLPMAKVGDNGNWPAIPGIRGGLGNGQVSFFYIYRTAMML